jgi:hypothetical protein
MNRSIKKAKLHSFLKDLKNKSFNLFWEGNADKESVLFKENRIAGD